MYYDNMIITRPYQLDLLIHIYGRSSFSCLVNQRPFIMAS